MNGSTPPRITTRRGWLKLIGLLPFLRVAHAQAPAAGDLTQNDLVAPTVGLPGAGPTLLVGGPPEGTVRELASLFAPVLGPALAAGRRDQTDAPPLTLDTAGGLDGVTAANEFEARANPDGSTALMVPGAAALAWLAGDPRVHFDAGMWIPAFAAVSPAVLVGRQPVTSLGNGARVRLAASTPAGPELPALLGLELIGLHALPIFGLRRPEEQEAALRQGGADAVLLTGASVPERLSRLRREGFVPLFSLGRPGGIDPGSRSPALPDIETLSEIADRSFGHGLVGPLAPAYRAASAACQIDVALVLPQLAPAGAIARWRAACDQAGNAPDVQSMTDATSLELLPAPGCVGAVSAVLAGETALLDLHRFLADRYGWRPA